MTNFNVSKLLVTGAALVSVLGASTAHAKTVAAKVVAANTTIATKRVAVVTATTPLPDKIPGPAAQVAARKAIASRYNYAATAAMHSDLPGVMKLVATDFQYYDLTGHVLDRVNYEALQSETMNVSTKVHYAYQIQSIQWRGPDAIVYVVNIAKGVINHKRFDLRTTARDYWSPTPQGWMIRQSVERSIHGFVNGEYVDYNPLQPMTPAITGSTR